VAGGLAFPNEAAPDAAKREFEEETGCRVLRIASGPQLYLQPGLGYFPVACFIAEAEPGNRQKLDNNEYIAPVFISATAKEIERQKATINEPVSLVLLEYFLRTRIKNPKKRH
jgi:8-oxo-dGTP pyrophosphatase MutT (NUDIX family)